MSEEITYGDSSSSKLKLNFILWVLVSFFLRCFYNLTFSIVRPPDLSVTLLHTQYCRLAGLVSTRVSDCAPQNGLPLRKKASANTLGPNGLLDVM